MGLVPKLSVLVVVLVGQKAYLGHDSSHGSTPIQDPYSVIVNYLVVDLEVVEVVEHCDPMEQQATHQLEF